MSCGPRTEEAKIVCGAGGGSERRVHVWYWPGETPSLVGHILMSWLGRSLVPAGLSPHLTPSNTNGPARPARRPFLRIVFCGVRRW